MSLTGIPGLADEDFYFGMVASLIQSLRATAPANVKLGAGFGVWVQPWRAWSARLAAMDVDFVNLHIYPADVFPPAGEPNVVEQMLTISDAQAAAGHPVVVGEAWLYKRGQGDTNDPVEIYGRDSHDFWAPLDASSSSSYGPSRRPSATCMCPVLVGVLLRVPAVRAGAHAAGGAAQSRQQHRRVQRHHRRNVLLGRSDSYASMKRFPWRSSCCWSA